MARAQKWKTNLLKKVSRGKSIARKPGRVVSGQII
jgi:hypothetical protein